jgi:hypothetical protein
VLPQLASVIELLSGTATMLMVMDEKLGDIVALLEEDR